MRKNREEIFNIFREKTDSLVIFSKGSLMIIFYAEDHRFCIFVSSSYPYSESEQHEFTNIEEMIQFIECLFRENKEDFNDFLFDVATELKKQGRAYYGEAIWCLLKIAEEPREEAIQLLADLYFDLGDFPCALYWINKNLRINPKSRKAKITKVKILIKQERQVEAYYILEEVLFNGGNDEEIGGLLKELFSSKKAERKKEEKKAEIIRLRKE